MGRLCAVYLLLKSDARFVRELVPSEACSSARVALDLSSGFGGPGSFVNRKMSQSG